MRRTPEREAFFAEVKRDPYTHAVMRFCADAWVAGYTQALRDLAERHKYGQRLVALAADDLRFEKSSHDRVDDYFEWMTGEKKRAEMEMVIALGALGKLVPDTRG